MAPRVFTIPASAPFLPTLIEALADGRLIPGVDTDDPLALSAATLYLPTRRACRLARETFLDVTGARAAVLPRIVPIGEPDQDEIAFDEIAHGEEALALPAALGGFERQMLLAELILRFTQRLKPAEKGDAALIAANPTSAFALAGDLARLMDDMTTRGVSWSALRDLVPPEIDRYWQLTLEFLTIASEHWPKHLAEIGAIEPAARRALLIRAEAARLARSGTPVIAAGSTASTPATADLLAAIAALPHGAVVLPGLDTDLDDGAWRAILDDETHAPTHPQVAMAALLSRLNLAREQVGALAAPRSHGRERLLAEAMRPAERTEDWRATLSTSDFAAHADTACATLSAIEAGSAEEEALAIAIALRETLETPGKTAALVTPDRRLARRVLAALSRWNVPVDDSGGTPLTETTAGIFARLVAEAALGGLSPVTLLACLKHPACRFALRDVAALERAVLRGPRPRAGTAGLAQALASLTAERTRLARKEPSTLHRSEDRARLHDEAVARATALAEALAAAFKPLEDLPRNLTSFSEIARRHRVVLQAIAATDFSDTPDGAVLFDAFDEIETANTLAVTPADYAELFAASLASHVVRRAETGARLRIYGALEARLVDVDRLVLGGLVEAVWPPDAAPDPWLSRPMRAALGLDLPERRIGLSAHDFAQALGAPEVILSRAAKRDGAPTVPSRFVQRLVAVAGPDRWQAALERGARYLTLARKLDEPEHFVREPRPQPKPPLEVRPTNLRVTEIEDLLRDPYTIYARHVLKLQPLDAVDTPPGAADRGTLIHVAIADFAFAHRDALPADALGALVAFGEKRFAPLADFPEASAFWWPRFLRIAEWFVAYERERRSGIAVLHAEVPGKLPIVAGEREITLHARADRIEQRADGTFALLDYKTGRPPTERQVSAGLSPQLTLQAAMIRRGGFERIAEGASLSQLAYVRLSGGAEAGEHCAIAFKDGSPPDAKADEALRRLTEVLTQFADPNRGYASLVHPMWIRRYYGDYDHLARVREWSLTGGLIEEIFA